MQTSHKIFCVYFSNKTISCQIANNSKVWSLLNFLHSKTFQIWNSDWLRLSQGKSFKISLTKFCISGCGKVVGGTSNTFLQLPTGFDSHIVTRTKKENAAKKDLVYVLLC